jgi:hypothetical protein
MIVCNQPSTGIGDADKSNQIAGMNRARVDGSPKQQLNIKNFKATAQSGHPNLFDSRRDPLLKEMMSFGAGINDHNISFWVCDGLHHESLQNRARQRPSPCSWR